METLEDFWAVLNKVAPPSKMAASCNYHLFREGVEPKWEDKANEGGGKWVHGQPRQQSGGRRDKLDKAWTATALAAVCEQLELEGPGGAPQVCGVVMSARKNQDRLALWLAAGPSNEAAVLAIGARWKTLLELRGQSKIGFQVHAEAISGGASGGSSFSRAAKFVV
jgi:translation initiation factor 4E